VSDLPGRLGIDDAANPRTALGLEKAAAVRDDRDRMARHAGVRAQHLGCVMWLKLQVIVVVDYPLDHLFDAVRKPMIVRNQVIQFLGGLRWSGPFGSARSRGKLSKVLTNELQTIGVVVSHVMRH